MMVIAVLEIETVAKTVVASREGIVKVVPE